MFHVGLHYTAKLMIFPVTFPIISFLKHAPQVFCSLLNNHCVILKETLLYFSQHSLQHEIANKEHNSRSQ